MKTSSCVVLVLVSLVSLLLAGCASGPNVAGVSSASGGKGDLVTESDEPENRRRARLRLELASGYFERGQTNVALDEVKRSLVADPGFADAYNLRGLVYMRLNDLPLAEDSFRALVLNPRDASTAHNYGWLLCQQARYRESFQMIEQAVANPTYAGQGQSLMALGVCQARAGLKAEAEQSLTRAYQVDAGNPVVGFSLASLLYDRGEFTRSQFYIRRLNNSELANAETLWLGIKIERRLENREVVVQLADQLKKRFGQSREAGAYDRGAFNE
jgi:type IV pilus assembly protein PilF